MITAYDFDQVSIIPRFNDYKSRAEAYKWIEADSRIIVANMAGIGSREFASKVTCRVALTVSDTSLISSEITPPNAIPTTGESAIFGHQWQYAASDIFMIDVANAYRKTFLENVSLAKRTRLKDRTTLAGNVCTFAGTWKLLEAGVDIVKVGIGSGSLCTTRRVAGVGVPQLTAIIQARRAVDLWNMIHPFDRPRMICSDGGITEPGDVAKAFVAGADYVMIGGLFMEACDLDVQTFQGSSVVNSNGGYKTSEGRVVNLKNKSNLRAQDIHQNILAGLASCATYIGARSYSDFRKKGKLVRVGKLTSTKFANHF